MAQEKDFLIRTASFKMENRDTLGALRDCNLAIAINPVG